MEFTPQVLEMVGKLQSAIATTYNPAASQEHRVQAFQILEKVKEDPQIAVMCGFCMAKQDYDFLCRHLGLQLLEFTIKYQWVDLPLELKVLIKNGVMAYMSDGTMCILNEQVYIKDKLSRLVVEMVKREWPQQWPMLLSELHDLTTKGPAQTELVMLVFLRLCEDVAILQNLESNVRRRDLYQALSNDMKDIFKFFLTCLCNYHNNYLQGNNQAECIQVIQTVLKTVATYSEWIPMEHLFMEDNQLLKYLCLMLSDDNFKMDASECLLQITSRRGNKPENKSALLYFFQEASMSAIYNSAEKSSSTTVNEKEYLFFKSLTQVITSLGGQLVVLWDDIPQLESQANFEVYLQALLCFSKHPSLFIYKYTAATWAQFFKHKHISKNDKLHKIIPEWFTVVSRKIVKHGYPYRCCDISSEYSRLDFDKDEEYSLFFYKTRGETTNAIKFATTIAPKVAFDFAVEWFTTVIKQPIITGSEQPLCNMMSPSYLEWDAMSLFLEIVITRVRSVNTALANTEEGKVLIKQCLLFSTRDPLILSTLLTCISGLFVFLENIPEALPEILNAIFSSLCFNQDSQTKRTRSRSVKNVRKHAASMLVSLARSSPKILLPAFDFLNESYNKLSEGDISQMEKCTVQEALVLLNNHFCDYNKQSLYLKSILTPISEQWLALKEPFSCPLKYMSFIGLDKPPTEPSELDICGQNRSQILACLNTIIAMIKRSEVPSQPNQAEIGGFVDKGSTNVKNPVTPHLLPLFHNMFCFIKVNLELWNSNCIASLSEGYAKSYNLPEMDRINLMGFSTPKPDDPCLEFQKVTEPLERMQHYLMFTHETWCQILGTSGRSMGLQFYEQPHLVEYIFHSIFLNLPRVADWRLRYIIKTFFRNFVISAPQECDQTIILPLVYHLCPFMLEKLTERWQYVDEQILNGHRDEDNCDVQEALEELMIRHTTREYIDVLKILLLENCGGVNGDEMEGEEENGPPNANIVNNTISSRGQVLLQCDNVCQAIFTTLLKSLWWDDTNACIKAVNILEVCIKWLVVSGSQHLNESAVDFMMMSVFRGLNKHGEHDANLTVLLNLGLHIYEIMLPIFPNLKMVLCKLPGVTEKIVESFESFLQNIPHSKVKPSKINKQKKEAFRDVVNGVIGHSRSEDMKLPVQIIDLPPMFKAPRPKQPSFESTTNNLGLCLLFG